MLFTNDAILLRSLLHPPENEFEENNLYKKKKYIVTLLVNPKRKLSNADDNVIKLLEEELSSPLSFRRNNHEIQTKCAKVKILKVYRDEKFIINSNDNGNFGWCLKVEVELNEGKHHQIRRIASRGKYIVKFFIVLEIVYALSIKYLNCINLLIY